MGVGDDLYGGSIIENMNAAGVDTRFTLGVTGCASGTALIMIGGQGENYLSVAPGANYQLLPRHVDLAWECIAGAAMVMVQAEDPARNGPAYDRKGALCRQAGDVQCGPGKTPGRTAAGQGRMAGGQRDRGLFPDWAAGPG